MILLLLLQNLSLLHPLSSDRKMSDLLKDSPISSFFVFDSDVPPIEGATVDILYYYPECKTKEEINRRDVEAGISSTFIYFCKQFRPDSPCDYVFTGKREIALLELEDGIFFSVSIHSNTSTRRLLLKEILSTIKEILFMSIGPMQKDQKTKKVSQKWRDLLALTMSSIISVINWKDPVFELLWNAYSPSTSQTQEEINDLNAALDKLLKDYPMISTLILTWRDKVISFKGCEPELCRLITLLVYHKYKVFFPRKMKKREDLLYWTVGFAKNELNAIEFYTPPTYWKGILHPLCVLQFNKFRIILLLDPKQIYDINILQPFTKGIYPIVKGLDDVEKQNIGQKKDNTFGKKVGVKLHHLYDNKSMIVTSNKVQVYDFEVVERGVLLAHEFSNQIGELCKGIIPLGNNFYSYFIRDLGKQDVYTVMQFKTKGTSDALNSFEKIVNGKHL